MINIRAYINKGFTTSLVEAFPNSISFPWLPVTLNNIKLYPQCIANFISGNGCFKISIRKSKLHKVISPLIIL